MNLANQLTISRILIVPIFLIVILPESFGIPVVAFPYCRTAALVIFIGAAITDYYDGVLARRHAWTSDFGKIIDPLADKLIVMSAFVAMIELKLFPSWMVVLILCREFLITGLRTLASGQGRILAADRWGKNKTISQMTVIITGLVYLAVRDILSATGHWEPYVVHRWELEWWLTISLKSMMFFCVALTIYSGLNYLRSNMDVIRESLK